MRCVTCISGAAVGILIRTYFTDLFWRNGCILPCFGQGRQGNDWWLSSVTTRWFWSSEQVSHPGSEQCIECNADEILGCQAGFKLMAFSTFSIFNSNFHKCRLDSPEIAVKGGGLANGRAPRIPSRLGCLTTWALCLHWDTKIRPWFARQLRCRLQLRRRLRLKFALSWNAGLRPVWAQPKACAAHRPQRL